MKKILLLLFSIILWNCTDYAAEWDEKYLAESSDPENSNPFQTSSASEEKMTEPSLSSSSQDMVLVDPRDGQSYRLVTIGDQVWMAENLNYETMDSYCYDNEPVNCALYGRLYTWAAALFACPSGWHLPSKWEFESLITAVGGEEVAGQKLKATKGWTKYDGIANEDTFGFSALPVGGYGKSAFFWSSADFGSSWTFSMMLSDDTDSAVVILLQLNDISSVRCIKDYAVTVKSSSSGVAISSSSSAAVKTMTLFIDSRDGQTYKTVTIGAQTWMAQNLNYETANSYCFNNSEDNCSEYGRLYTWSVAISACPSGWHLPNQGEFQQLLDVSGGIENLKANAWDGADLYGFSALPAGKYDAIAGGSFTTSQMQTGWWLQSESSVTSHALLYAYSNGWGIFDSDDCVNGFSVRCLKD